jgi:hypothetical protein
VSHPTAAKAQIPVTSTIFVVREEISSAMKDAEGYPPVVVKMISCLDATLVLRLFFASCVFIVFIPS